MNRRQRREAFVLLLPSLTHRFARTRRNCLVAILGFHDTRFLIHVAWPPLAVAERDGGRRTSAHNADHGHRRRTPHVDDGTRASKRA
eukprot:5886613-Pleurochrysis_carterae.AAC.1